MLVGLGIDVIEISRVSRELASDPDGFKNQLFTPAEIDYCDRMRYPARHYAVRFAAKEALFKALGTGVPRTDAWREVEVHRDSHGRPQLAVHGRTRKAVHEHRASRVFVSLSRSREWAVAGVVLES